MDIAGGLKEENILIINADLPLPDLDRTGLMDLIYLQCMTFPGAEQALPDPDPCPRRDCPSI